MIEPNHFGIPPWNSSELWSQIVSSLEYLHAKRGQQLVQAQKLANRIEKKLRAVNGDLETLCNATCESCIDICCKKATVWYDFKDILYLKLSSGSLPAGQIYKKPDLACCKLTLSGCELPRTRRPFICTWYICPEQVARCSVQEREGRQNIQNAIQEIQELRKQLEYEFIQAVR